MQMQVSEKDKIKYIKSCFNYTGGKYKLLPQIMPLIPKDINTFWDIFCGGCNVGINVEANSVKFNDKIIQLIDLYKVLQNIDVNKAIFMIEEIIFKYSLSDTYNNTYDKYSCNSAKGLAEYNRNGYLRLREDYNKMDTDIITKNIMLYVLSIYGFNNQLRFNRKGEYNIPVGKRDFNEKVRKNFVDFVSKIKNENISFQNNDFRNINYDEINSEDFVYADPPYLITTATYNEQGGWTEDDEKNLLYILDLLNEKKIKFALSNVLKSKGNTNTILLEWSKKYNVHKLNYTYNNANYQKKNKCNENIEVLITNY